MSNNIFTVSSQEELNTFLNHYTPGCKGHCDHCPEFRKASQAVHALAIEQGVTMTLTLNGEPASDYGMYQVWCESCQDGANDSFLECTDWARYHVSRKHGINGQS